MPPCDAFFTNLLNHDPLEADYNHFGKIFFSGHTKQEALIEMKVSTASHPGTKTIVN